MHKFSNIIFYLIFTNVLENLQYYLIHYTNKSNYSDYIYILFNPQIHKKFIMLF